MSANPFKPNKGNFSPLTLLMLALISGFAANHGAVNATTVPSHIQPATITAPFAPVTAKYWGQDNRLGNFGDLYQNFGNYNHNQGYFMLMVQQPDRYWYYPNAGSSSNPWWWFVGGDLATATKVSQNIKATLKSGRYKVRPWVGKVGDQYLNISRAAPMVDVYSLKVLGAESAPYPAVGTEDANWKFVETINFAQPASTFSHAASFTQLDVDFDVGSEYVFDNANSYRLNTEYSAQIEHKTLMSRYNRYVPSGRNVTILQAESSHTPSSAGDVKQLFQQVATNSHAYGVAGLLNQLSTYPSLKTRYVTLSPNLRKFHTSTTENLRNFNASARPGNWYPATSVDGQAISPADLLNRS